MRIARYFLVAAITSLSLPMFASDWKYAGVTLGKAGAEILFYDSEGVFRNGSTTRFWVKAVPLKRINEYATPKRRASSLIESSARRIADGYVPSFLLLRSVKALSTTDEEYFARVADAVLWEVVVAENGAKMASRFCFEINCASTMIRTIEGDIYTSTGAARPEAGALTQEWSVIAPDSNSAGWSELLCLQR